MSKLTKFLESFCKKVENEDTDTMYYKYEGLTIRVADHLPPQDYKMNLQIIFPKNSKNTYLLCLDRQIFIHNSFTTLRVFLENWKICVDTRITRLEASQSLLISNLKKDISTLEAKNKKLKIIHNELMQARLSNETLKAKLKGISTDIVEYHFNELTIKQKSELAKWIINNVSIPNKEKLLSKLIN